MNNLRDVITEAIKDFEENGFDSETRLNEWIRKIRQIIEIGIDQQQRLDAQFRDQMRTLFDRLVGKETIAKDHNGIPRFTIKNLAFRLHAELDRRIIASAGLIRYNREDAVNKTLQRFSGWATSVPKGGTNILDKRAIKSSISKPLAQLPYVERRVLIDQGHKLNSSISAVIANDGGAIAARWFSKWKQPGYDFREDHKERDGIIYLIRDSWAMNDGLINNSNVQYSDDITQPAEEPFCGCRFVYLYHLRQLPEDMLTAKGKASLQKVRGL